MKIPLLVAARRAFFQGRRLPRHRVRRQRPRLRLRPHPGNGRATAAALCWRWGRGAAFFHSRRTRPGLGLAQRLPGPAAAHSALTGRARHRHGPRLPPGEHAVTFSPPRGGKTGWPARVILHCPGPVLSTTTRHDVFELTSAARSRRGPVRVLSPRGAGGVPPTFRWDPPDGCADPAAAIRRADAFARSVSQRGVEDASFRAVKAPGCLRAYLHGAALAGQDLRRVASWVPGVAEDEAEDILHTMPGAARHLADQLAEMRGEANKTISTVRMTMSRALAFLAGPALAACVLPGLGESLDLVGFLREAGTLYLVAETPGEDSPVAPLFACLASEIHHAASLAGSRQRGGRLDPPLLMALDEVTQICRSRCRPSSRTPAARHPDHPGRARRGAAADPVGAQRGAGHHGTPPGRRSGCPGSPTPRRWTPRPGCAARPRCGSQGSDQDGVTTTMTSTRGTRHDPGDDPPAPGPLRPGHPRRHVPGDRPAADGLARPRLPCWEQHPLRVYGLDWLMELWSALYLTGARSASAAASQAGWQTRLLPALAGQMRREASRCQHGQSHARYQDHQ